MEKPFVIYRSSAGSGKTFTLALEYLKLALRPQASYRTILAVTFTNKATKEMKSRIIAFLYSLSQGETGAVREALLESTGYTDTALTQHARTLLTHILHGYAYFSVMTIDAFFQKVIRAFARETGLQAGFSLELDQDKVLNKVVDTLLEELGTQDTGALTEWLTRFAEERVEEGKNWDFRKDIKNLGAELLKENYKVQEEAFRSLKLSTVDTWEVLRQLKVIQATFEQQMETWGIQGLQQIKASGLEVDDFAYKASGVAGYFFRLAATQDFDPKARARAAADNPEAWTAKSAARRADILAAVGQGLQQTLQQAIGYYDLQSPQYYGAMQLLRFIYTYAILKDIDSKLTDYKRKNDVMLISDASIFLKDIIGKDETPFIYEKIGTYYQHFLIDEFQDTSGLQWNNFRPLIENSLDAGNYNLVVGDVKQAIYRWRGGDWQLLLDKIQQDMAPWRTQVKNLDKNYRSKKNIVDFNNRVFQVLPRLLREEMQQRLEDIPDDALRQDLSARAQIITHAYEDAFQQLPEAYDTNELWQGLVEIQLLRKEELQDAEGQEIPWKEKVQQALPQLIENLQDQGYALRDIAFLVRDKRDGKAVADTFMDYKVAGKTKPGYAYEVISPESLFLEASLSVGLLIDLLRFLDNPFHVLAKGNILYKYRHLKGQEVSSDQLHDLFLTAGKTAKDDLDLFYDSLPEAFRHFRPYLNKLPLYELIENLIRIFEIHQSTELAYLQAFQDAALEYTKSEKGDLHSFLAWWDEKGRQTSVQISEQVDAMRILTIHKAKGLEFKVVILPFCDWSLDHHPWQQNILWTYTDQKPFQEMGLMPLKYSKELIRTVFSPDYYQEMLRAHLDNLNLLYVATTRARECLYAFAAPKITQSGCPLNSIANALYRGLTEQETPAKDAIHLSAYWDETAFRFTLGYEPAGQEKAGEESQRVVLQSYPSVRWRNRLMVQPRSHNFFVRNSQSGRMEVNRAVLYRDVLIRMKNAAGLPQVLDAVYFERGIHAAEKPAIAEAISRLLDLPEISAWYTSTFDQIQIKPTLFLGNGKFVVPDRLMIRGDTVTVVNFDMEEKKKNELLKSVTLLKGAGYRQTQGYLAKLPEGEVIKID